MWINPVGLSPSCLYFDKVLIFLSTAFLYQAFRLVHRFGLCKSHLLWKWKLWNILISQNLYFSNFTYWLMISILILWKIIMNFNLKDQVIKWKTLNRVTIFFFILTLKFQSPYRKHQSSAIFFNIREIKFCFPCSFSAILISSFDVKISLLYKVSQ